MNDTQNASVMKQISAKLRTSSAVVPAILTALIAMPIGASGLAFANAQYNIIFGIVLLSPLFVIIYQILFFTHFDRDRLHNEEHIERRMQIDRGNFSIGDNSTGREILIEGRPVSSQEIEGNV